MSPSAESDRKAAVALCTRAYLIAGAVALVAGWLVRDHHPFWVAAIADLAATLVIFGYSYAYDNSSFYDPYWSVAPPLLALAWATHASAAGADSMRQVVVILLVALWALRLTWNWLRGWQGLQHEDWRYVDLRAKTGGAYWLVSFLGLHVFPTIVVLLGCLPLYAAVTAGGRPFGWLDVLAAAVTLGAVAIEATADEQLRAFRRRPDAAERTLSTGLWAWSRHPNYFGETSFWWGLCLFGLAAHPAWWTAAGAVAITLMFVFVSIPMIDQRMLARRPDYAARMQTVPALVPRPPRTS